MVSKCIWWIILVSSRCTMKSMTILKTPPRLVSNENVCHCSENKGKKKINLNAFFGISGEFDGEDSSNSKLFRNFAGIDKKATTNKDSMNSTDNDIMVNCPLAPQLHKCGRFSVSSFLRSHFYQCHRRVKNRASRLARRSLNCFRSRRPKSVR